MKSLWLQSTTLPAFESLNGEHKTDVLIIGGGIAGILTAYFLEQKGVSYILLEKDRICRGTTSNTTAKITYQHGLIYHKLVKSLGIEMAQMYYKANKAAFSEYKRLCSGIECDYEIKNNYVYSKNNRSILEKELNALYAIGCDAAFCEEIPLPFKTAGGIEVAHQAQFNPLEFLKHITKDLNIFENTFVRELIGNTALCDSAKVTAEKIIVTTHFPFLNKHGSYFLKLYQHRSYVVAFENAPNLCGMYVDNDKKGMSFRNYKNLLLIGGEGHRTGGKSGNLEFIKKFAYRNYHNITPKYYWAAQDCMSLDSVPYIGEYSDKTKNLYTATGFNKWGITSSMAAAMILSDMVTNKSNEFAAVFNPSRSILKPQIAVNGFEAAKNLLTISKKRCPHLGCALKWNSAERSWDCPCHGSRFSENGKVLDNPANGDLP